jgi:cobalt/nickel transport system ATP-binding protein
VMNEAVLIESFSYVYPDGTPALTDINLSIEHGQRVALIGPNGAGKSTLLLAMAGFVRGAGKVAVDGLSVNGTNKKKIHTIIGSCLENPDDQLFMPTLFDDIAFGPMNMGLDGDEVRKRVDESLATVGLAGMGHKAPHHLSAGQKRAAAIATVISMSPKIITLDEPDGSLDPGNRKNLVRILSALTQTLVIATCNMNFASALADRAVLIDAGRIIADGPANNIMRNAELMQAHGLETPSP